MVSEFLASLEGCTEVGTTHRRDVKRRDDELAYRYGANAKTTCNVTVYD